MPHFAPAATCPDGTKAWVLNLGVVDADEGFVMQLGGTSSKSNPNPESQLRHLVVLAVLIEMPGQDGLILYDTGCAKDMPKEWGNVLLDIFAPNTELSRPDNTLPKQIESTGHSLADVKHVILSHLHIDHAGGLDFFKGREDVTFYCDELELKHAFWAVATKIDRGIYLPHYLSPDYPWKTFRNTQMELFPGLELIQAPGHSPGLVLMLLHLKGGALLFTSDQYHVEDNFKNSTPQGWLSRDFNEWHNTHSMVQQIVKKYSAKVCFGHDLDVLQRFEQVPSYHT